MIGIKVSKISRSDPSHQDLSLPADIPEVHLKGVGNADCRNEERNRLADRLLCKNLGTKGAVKHVQVRLHRIFP